MATEYEVLLKQMIEERMARLGQLKDRQKDEKTKVAIRSEVRFIEVELERYQKGMALFRTKSVPKVGRWGKAETTEEPAGH